MTRAIALLGCALLAGSGAQAADIPPALAACADDVGRYCPTIAPGEGRLVACLRPHAQELSDACRAQLAPLLARRRAEPAMGPRALITCQKDTKAYCADVTTGQGRLKKCLEEHDAQLSARCRAAVRDGAATSR